MSAPRLVEAGLDHSPAGFGTTPSHDASQFFARNEARFLRHQNCLRASFARPFVGFTAKPSRRAALRSCDSLLGGGPAQGAGCVRSAPRLFLARRPPRPPNAVLPARLYQPSHTFSSDRGFALRQAAVIAWMDLVDPVTARLGARPARAPLTRCKGLFSEKNSRSTICCRPCVQLGNALARLPQLCGWRVWNCCPAPSRPLSTRLPLRPWADDRRPAQRLRTAASKRIPPD